MMPSPLHYAAGRGGQMDAAEAELQTDVMRFLAILSLCLVAMFALVQTIPVAQTSVEEPRAIELPRAASVLSKPPTTPTPPREATAAKSPSPIAVPVVVSKPAGKTIESVTVPAPDSAPPKPRPIEHTPAEPESAVVAQVQPQQDGFTLQFEDGDALTRLISRDEVGFFAIAADKSMQLKIDSGRMDFWPASTPGQYHEMDALTVPAEVQRALLRSGAEFGPDQLWGVTLPPRTAAQLNQFLSEASGGRLVIGGNGDLRMEQ